MPRMRTAQDNDNDNDDDCLKITLRIGTAAFVRGVFCDLWKSALQKFRECEMKKVLLLLDFG